MPKPSKRDLAKVEVDLPPGSAIVADWPYRQGRGVGGAEK
jgi:hypothetical protein